MLLVTKPKNYDHVVFRVVIQNFITEDFTMLAELTSQLSFLSIVFTGF
jgi:hypothetical protein